MTLKPCASIEYLEIYGTPDTQEDLRNHRLCDYISFPTDGAWKVWADIVADSPNVCYRTNSSLALGEATKNGLGISLQPIGLQYREPTLKVLDIEGIAPSLRFWLSCHKSVKDIPRIRALINHIKSDIFLNPVPGSAFYSDV
jgi:DNA-binding transcriptional LysR family regulator